MGILVQPARHGSFFDIFMEMKEITMKRNIQSLLMLGVFMWVSVASVQGQTSIRESGVPAAMAHAVHQPQQDEKTLAREAKQRAQAEQRAAREANQRERALAKQEKQRLKAQKQREKALKRLDKAQKKVTSLENRVSKQTRKVDNMKNKFYVKLNRGRLSDIDEQKERIKINKQELKLRELELDLERAIGQAGRLR